MQHLSLHTSVAALSLAGAAPMQRETVKKVAKVFGSWLPVILLVLIFAPQGWAKFSDDSGWARAFRHWGYPTWFRVLIGIAEVGGALLLLHPRTARIGAA